jgi:uncharacterized protein YndB with AHSA1/START domain
MTISISTEIQAPIEKVWEYWTAPRHIIRWNHASDDWCTLKATNDIRTGGKFSSTMAAKDGSISFDFEGVYNKVIPRELIEYTLSDGRVAKVVFEPKNDFVKITESFEAEEVNPVEMQKAGWQAILNNFKKHTEENGLLSVIQFSILIQAPVEKVFKTMLEKDTYQQWTSEFNPTSTYEGNWQKNSKILFVGTSTEGEKEGMVSRIREHVPNYFISVEHLGLVRGNDEITSGKEVEGWAGCLENYTFIDQNNSTLLEVDMDANKEFKSYFEEAWPRALKKLKTICEQ